MKTIYLKLFFFCVLLILPAKLVVGFSLNANVEQAFASMQTGKLKEAEQILISVLKQEPTNQSAQFLLAQIEIKYEKFASAKKRLEWLLKVNSAQSEYLRFYEFVKNKTLPKVTEKPKEKKDKHIAVNLKGEEKSQKKTETKSQDIIELAKSILKHPEILGEIDGVDGKPFFKGKYRQIFS